MEPTQVAPAHSNSHKILVIILALMSLTAVAFLTYKLIGVNKELNELKGVQTMDTQSKTASNTYSQKNATYTISEINDLIKGKFEMNAFPSATFTISKITRVEGLKVAGCATDFPEEIQKTIRLAGCYSNNFSDPETNNKSLVGIDIDVSNNSKKVITGDIIKIVYYESREGETVARISSLGAVPFSSYSINPLSDRKVSLATWIPNSVTKIDLIYGMDDFTTYHEQLADIQNADGRIIIDFNQSAITDKKILRPIVNQKEIEF